MTATDESRFTLSEHQQRVHHAARRFAEDRLAPTALEWDERGELPVALLHEAGRLGYGAVLVDDEGGGPGLSRLEAALVFEGLSYGDPAIATFISVHNMAAWAIDTFGSTELRGRWLPRMAGMEVIASFCLTEPEAGSDATALTTRAVRDGGGNYRISGVKSFITGGSASQLYVVICRTGEEFSAILVEGNTPGLSFGANEKKMGWRAQPTTQMSLADAEVPVTNRLGSEGAGLRIALAALDGGRLNIAACSVGAAQAALDRAVAYIKQRRAFGKTLSAFQALQFTVADAQTELEAARSLVYVAATRLDAGDPTAGRFCAMAKRYASDIGFRVANDALQLHGGYGYLREYGIEKLVRDLRGHQIVEGTNEIMRLVIARSLLDT